ncbi:hypothetical protein LXL04_007240 [Taraxacum kok-saghyz]
MDSNPSLTILEQYKVSPPPATVPMSSLPLTFFDFPWLLFHPIHTLLFYGKAHFTETIIPRLKSSLSITLKHVFPYVGNVIVYPTSPSKKPEIGYVEGDSVAFTSAECNFDFTDLTGNHPRNCDKFYPLIPILSCTKVSEFVKIQIFSVQVTLFPNHGFSIGMSCHHSMGDASTQFSFLNAWTSIARCGTDELYLVNGTLPIYDRLIKYPKLDERFLKNTNLDTFNQNYQLPILSGPSDKVRSTFVLTRNVTNKLKKMVLTQQPTIPYVSSFTVACAYIWSCMAESRNDELELFCFYINCRPRMNPPIPAAYFGNCVIPCITIEKTALLKGKEGFVTATKLLGENLNKILTDKDGVVNDSLTFHDSVANGMPTTTCGVAGTPKLKFYDMDFGWGKPKSYETICLDYDQSISMNCSKELNEAMEIGLSLSSSEMEAFVRIFNRGLEAYI